jgi:hypothetical protein
MHSTFNPCKPNLFLSAAAVIFLGGSVRAASTIPALEAHEKKNPTAEPVRPATQSRIDKHELLGHIRHLSSKEFRGREAGTPDQLAAAKYIAEEFARYGISSLGDEKEGKTTYFQEFSMDTSLGFGKANALSLTVGDKVSELSVGKDFAPFPAGVEQAQARGGVVFAGYGIIAPEYKYNDFANLDLAGKWALVLRYEPQEQDTKSKFGGKELTRHASLAAKVYNCLTRNAVGVLIVTGPAGRENDAEKLVDGSGTLIGDFEVPVLQITRATADKILSQSGKSVKSLQAAIDAELSNQSFALTDVSLKGTASLQHDKKLTWNVIAKLEGSDEKLKSECVVIGAHCDHVGMGGEDSLLGKEGVGKIHYGADDNASGSAGLLEIAQYLGSLKPAERPKRSILLMAFSGEEKGLLGSQYYLQHPKVPLKDTVAMLNLDMIGRSQQSFVQVAGIGSSKGFKDLVQKAAEDLPLHVQLATAGNGPSDHASFYNKQIPVLFFFTHLHGDYHRPTDTWDKINAPAAEAVAELARKLLVEIATNPVRPEFVKNEARGYLGISPDSKKLKESKGYPIGAVLPKSPAEVAGLKAGDVIIAVNGNEVADASDLAMAMIDYGANDEVLIRVMRSGAVLEMPLKIAAR